MNKINDNDMLYALVIQDNDSDYENDNSNDTILLNGEWADSFNRIAGVNTICLIFS